jgi:gliding motility-associated-like protein
VKKSKLFLMLSLLMLLTSAVIAQPNWTVNPGNYDNNMTVTGTINLDFTESTDVNDMVGAFIDGECRGINQPIYQASIDRYIVYLMIYSNDVTGTINFKVYDASTDTEIDIPATMEFSVNGIVGSTEAPYIWSSPTLSNKAEILTFIIPGQIDTTTYNGTNIFLKMPYGSDLSSLVADYTTSPNALVMVNSVVQSSGITANNFSAPVQYWVRSADETTEQTYTIEVTYANAIPSDIYMSSNEISETESIGSVIGYFSTEDANLDDTHTYSFITGTGDSDNENFIISGNELLLNTQLDFETKSLYSIRIQTDDHNGGLFEKQFAVNVIDEVESIANAPNVISPNNDCINDYWELEHSHTFNNCNFFIFNNIGEIIYESTGYNNDWNGTYKGKQLPIGTYYYVIKCPNCSNCNYAGAISLIR